MFLIIVAIVIAEILLSFQNVKVVVNDGQSLLQLTGKIIATMSGDGTDLHDVIESDQCADLTPKMVASII
jgi:hypothetical protein